MHILLEEEENTRFAAPTLPTGGNSNETTNPTLENPFSSDSIDPQGTPFRFPDDTCQHSREARSLFASNRDWSASTHGLNTEHKATLVKKRRRSME